MLAARLRARCPSARVIGRAEATGFHLTFDKIGQDGSGKATLVPGDGVVPGVLFDLAAEDVHLLDRIEGLGRGYDRVMLDLVDDIRPEEIEKSVEGAVETFMARYGKKG